MSNIKFDIKIREDYKIVDSVEDVELKEIAELLITKYGYTTLFQLYIDKYNFRDNLTKSEEKFKAKSKKFKAKVIQ